MQVRRLRARSGRTLALTAGCIQAAPQQEVKAKAGCQPPG